MQGEIRVRWTATDAKGTVDVFPTDEFKQAVTKVERTHVVLGVKGGEHSARYRLDVAGAEARLDYRAFAAANRRRGMVPGVLRFRFADAERTMVSAMWWNGKRIGPGVAEVNTVPTDLPISTADAVSRAHRALAEVTVRPEQRTFRLALNRTYGSKCCITGCTVEMALEAAHIEAIGSSGSDHPTNGLLLRSDLHQLFDSGHLAIDPKSKTVHLSSEARGWAGYAALHGKKLAPTQAGLEANAPSPKALKKRWMAFNESGRQ